MTIDWNGKLEAVHTDGTVLPAISNGMDSDGGYTVAFKGVESWYVKGNGSVIGTQWTIRNIASAASTSTPMEFGPEIKVDGKRPEWLDRDTQILMRDKNNGKWYGGAETILFYGRDISEDDDAIRLPVNHPHYNLITHTYTVRPEDEATLLASDPLSRSTPDERAVAPELVYRMKNAILRHVACKPYLFDDDEGPNISVEAELRSIAAALEPVVDEDLVIAREIAGDALAQFTTVHQGYSTGALNAVRTGNDDRHPAVVAALAAIKRGRALASNTASRDVTPCTREQFEEACRI